MNARSIASRVTLVMLALLASPVAAQMSWSLPIPFVETGASRADAGDFDGDGLADVALSFPSGRVSWLLGDGSGMFTPAMHVEDAGAGEILLRAFDRDGFDDAVVLSRPPDWSRVTFLFSNSRGTVPSRLDVVLPEFASDVDVADLDADGWLDVVLAFSSGTLPGIRILYGASGRTFRGWREFANGTPTTLVSAADVNGDGRVDLVSIPAAVPTSVSIRLSAYRVFRVAGAFAVPSGDTTPRQVVALDLDGDGPLEIACCTQDLSQGSQLFLFRGTLTTGFELIHRTTGDVDPTVSFPDLDGEERLDVLLGGARWSQAIFETSWGEFASTASVGMGGGTVVSADVDADGLPDLVSSNGVALNRCHATRRGTVDSAVGRQPFDVLLVNGSPGVGRKRTLAVPQWLPFDVRIAAPPSRGRGTAPFCLYGWIATPRVWDSAPGESLAPLCLPTPLTGGSPQPAVVWNNFPGARAARLGTADRFSLPAPAVVVDRRGGFPRGGAFFLQGVIRDPGSPNGVVAATNAIQVFVP